jgi:hypothetical protein
LQGFSQNADGSIAAQDLSGGMTPDQQNMGGDFSNFSIEDALNYQKANNMNLEEFITIVANKIKF